LLGEEKGGSDAADDLTTQFVTKATLTSLSGIYVPKLYPTTLSTQF